MSITTRAIEAGGATPPATVKVWDPFVRVFHWTLVSLFAVAFVTGDDAERLHLAAGYAIVALLAARLVWGFLGPRHARFSDFVRPPREVLRYLRDVALFRASRHIGHNPTGGVMIIALLLTLAGTAATGVMMTTDAYWGVKWVKEVHEALANLMLVLVALHVLGVVVASLTHRENLIKAMFTGRKRA